MPLSLAIPCPIVYATLRFTLALLSLRCKGIFVPQQNRYTFNTILTGIDLLIKIGY